jgi:hypothetical protein
LGGWTVVGLGVDEVVADVGFSPFDLLGFGVEANVV